MAARNFMVTSAISTPQQQLVRAPRSAALRFLHDPYVFMTRAQARYGDLFLLDLGLTKVAIASHPAHIVHVLRTRASNYPKEGSMWDGLRSLLGNGLAVSQGNHWRRQRRMMQPHFHRQRLAAITDRIAATIEEVLRTWNTRVDEPVNMNELCPHITMSVIVQAIFGSAIADRDVNAAGDALRYALDFLARGMLLQALPGWIPLPGRRGYQQSLKIIDDVIYRIIEQRRRDTNSSNDLLSMFIDLVDDETGAKMTDEELHDEVLTMFLAGYETTAIGMAWAFNDVAKRPKVAQRIRDEVQEVTGGQRPRFEHLPRLTYTRMVVKEAFRLHPPVWQIMRTALEDDEIGGVSIPAGTQLMLSFCGSHRHPAYWPDPTRFDPLRFGPEQEKARPREAWMPFGTGRRMCIGIELSMMESCLMMAQVLSRFSVSPIPGRPPREKVSTVLTCHDGIWLQLNRL